MRISVRRPVLVQNASATANIYISESEPILIASVQNNVPTDGFVLNPGNFLPELTQNSPALFAYADAPGGELEVIEKRPPVYESGVIVRCDTMEPEA
jgi:hypothetical protein